MIDLPGNPLMQNKYSVIEMKKRKLEYHRKQKFVSAIIETFQSFEENVFFTVNPDLSFYISSMQMTHQIVLSTLMTTPYRIVINKVTEKVKKYLVEVKAKIEYDYQNKKLELELSNNE